MTSAPARSAFDGVGEGSGSGREGGHEQVESGGDFLVAQVGFPFPAVDAFGVALDGVEPFPLVLGVHLIEGAHAHRVTPTSLPEILRAIWQGLTDVHRLAFSAGIPLGCLFFLIVGSITR